MGREQNDKEKEDLWLLIILSFEGADCKMAPSSLEFILLCLEGLVSKSKWKKKQMKFLFQTMMTTYQQLEKIDAEEGGTALPTQLFCISIGLASLAY